MGDKDIEITTEILVTIRYLKPNNISKEKIKIYFSY